MAEGSAAADDPEMLDDVATATAVSKELVPAVREFTTAVGQSSAGREIGQWIADVVRYKRLPHQAKLLMKAAEAVRACGLPTSAVEDRLLRAVLEEGGFEDDEEMQDRWARLLANAAVGVAVPPAFPEILRQIEPVEARLLDTLVMVRRPLLHGQTTHLEDATEGVGLRWRHLDNLERLQLLNYIWGGPVNVPLPPTPRDCPRLTIRLYETQLGRDFVTACAQPGDEPDSAVGDVQLGSSADPTNY